MTDIATSVRSERELDEATLVGTSANLDGQQTLDLLLPAGFGDCYVLRATCQISSIATLATIAEMGVSFVQYTSSGSTAALPGTAEWVQHQDAGVTASWEFFRPVLWREGEKFGFQFAEIDTNATPTADAFLMVHVLRRRNIGSPPGRRRRFQLTS